MAQSYSMSIQHSPRPARGRLGHRSSRRPAASAPSTSPSESRAVHDRGKKARVTPRAGVTAQVRGVKRSPAAMPAPQSWPERFKLYAPSVLAPLAVLALGVILSLIHISEPTRLL